MRPLGVTLIGFYQIFRGVVGLLFGLSLLVFTELADKLISLAAEGHAVERFLNGLGYPAGMVIIVFSGLHLVTGYGLLQIRNWGRLLTLLLSAIGLVLLLPILVFSRGFPLVFGIINVVLIFYLAMPPVKRAFHDAGHSLRMAA